MLETLLLSLYRNLSSPNSCLMAGKAMTIHIELGASFNSLDNCSRCCVQKLGGVWKVHKSLVSALQAMVFVVIPSTQVISLLLNSGSCTVCNLKAS